MKQLRDVVDALPRERTQLLDNLGAIRRHVGPVTPDLSDSLADHMNIRRGEVAEVVSFYSYLQLPHDCVRVCTGPVCDCFGARDLLAQAQERAEAESPWSRSRAWAIATSRRPGRAATRSSRA